MNNESNILPLVIDVKQLARILCIGKGTAYELVRSGQVRSVKVGRTYRIPRKAVDEYLNPSA